MPPERPAPRKPAPAKGGKGAKGKASRAKTAAAKGPARLVVATNRRARHAYSIEGTVEAGLVLLGSEVRALRDGRASIAEGHARLEGDELWLVGVHVPPLLQAGTFGHEPLRRRKCLVHRAELRRFADALESPGTTIVPLQVYFLRGRVKVELGIARGRRKGDRRERELEKEHHKDMRAALRP